MKKPLHLFYETLFALLLLVSYAPRFSSAIVHLRGKSLSLPFNDAPARFAVRVNKSGICGALYVADPLDACSSLRSSFTYQDSNKVRFVLIERGECAFEDKVRNAQESGFDVAIVFDNHDKRNLVSMIGSSEGIWVHAVFVSKAAGEILKKLAQGEEGECCISPSIEEAAWTVLVISFISLLVIVSVLATFFFTRNRHAIRQGTDPHSPSIDRQIVEVLPCFTFNTCRRDQRTGETCAICLEDYIDGEILRILPCHHEFHAKCVDSWLTKWGTFCPVCKHEMSADKAGHLASEETLLLS